MRILDSHTSEVDLEPGKRRRTLQNWRFFKTPSTNWAPCSNTTEFAENEPPAWEGAYEFEYGARNAVLQAHFIDRAAPVGEGDAMLGVRSSEHPENWLNIKPLGGNDVWCFPDEDRVEWPDYWTDTNLLYRVRPNKVIKEIEITGFGGPRRFQFSLRLAPLHTFEVADNALKVYDSTGKEWLHAPPVWGIDANGNALNVTLTQGEDITYRGKTYPSIWLELSEDDFNNAPRPLMLDPTATINGTTNIEDTVIKSGNPTRNFGAATSLPFGSNQTGLIRVAAGAIPAGTLNAARLIMYSGSTTATTITAYIVKDANNWVEGTGNNTEVAGTASWTHTQWATVAWAGSSGCATSGTDYDADASPPSVAKPASAGWSTLTLLTAWFTAWRDAARTNNGTCLFGDLAAGIPSWTSTEGASNQLYFEIDYTVGGGAVPIIMNQHRFRRM